MDTCKWIAALLMLSINAYRFIVLPLLCENTSLRAHNAAVSVDRYDQRLKQFHADKGLLNAAHEQNLQLLEGQLARDLDNLGLTARPLGD